jgi:O-antigen/teichoic acid export membrane protein
MRLLSNFSSQSLRNASWGGFSSLTPPLLQLAATPFLLHSLQPEVFGLWILLSSILAVSAVADMGLAPATTLFVSRYRVQKLPSEVRRVAQASLTLFVVLALLIAGLLIPTLPRLLHFLGTPEGSVDALSSSLPFFCFSVGLQLIQIVPSSIIRGYERYDVDGIMYTLSSAVMIVVLCGTVYLGGGLNQMLVAQSCVLGASFVTALLISILLVGSKAWLVPYCSVTSFKDFASLGIYGWIQGLSTALFAQADRLIVSFFLGPSMLAYYSAALQVAQTLHSLMARSLAFLFPRFTALQDSRAAALRLFDRAMFVTTALGSAAAIALFFASRWILHLWLGETIPAELPSVLSLLAVANAFMATTIVPSALLLGSGQFRLGAIFSLSSGLVVSVAALALVPAYGLLGAAAAKLSFLPVSLVSRVFVYHKVFGTWSWSLGIRQLVPVATALAPSILLILVSGPQPYPEHQWLWPALAAICGLALMWIQCRRQYGPL